MFKVVRQTRRFKTNCDKDLQEYDEILNDPLCSIVEKKDEKIKETDYSDEGKPLAYREWIEYIVTWERKVFV